MFNEIYFKLEQLEMEVKNKIARKSSLESSYKAFVFINNNIDKIKSEYILSILSIINSYLEGLKLPKKEIDYSVLEVKTSNEYNKLITNSIFIKLKEEYINNYQKEKEAMLWELENKFIMLANSKKSKLNTNNGFNIFTRNFNEFYNELLNLLTVMKLDIKNMYFIKNVLLFMKCYGIDETELINKSNVKEMLIKYDKVKRK